jgi:hypothetical protein
MRRGRPKRAGGDEERRRDGWGVGGTRKYVSVYGLRGRSVSFFWGLCGGLI